MAWLIVLLFVLILCRVPIAFALSFVSFLGIMLTDPGLLINIPRKMFNGIDSFTLVAVPLFILAGELMTQGGISKRLIKFSQTLVGHLPGGLALVVVLASMFFSALTGTAIAAAAAIGGMMIPAMNKEGYDIRFSTSLVATSATIGPIIPPSIVLILYGVIASVSIGDLFIAGVIPGLLMGIGLMIYSYFVGKKHNYRSRAERASFKEIITGAKDAILALLMPLIIIGGITSGVFTATESGVIAVLYAFIVGKFVYKELEFKALWNILLSTAKTTATIVFLIGNAALFIWFLSFNSIPNQIIDMLGGISESPFLLLLIINVILLIAGTFIDTISAVSIFTPLFLPLVLAAGIDPIHFGIIMAVNLTIGMATPPLGVCLFVTAAIGKISVPKMFKFLFPQVIILIVILFIITYIPDAILFPVHLFNG
ncbi:C4-dicarboxylate transporter DctM subunit [Cytobacillus oceanisediminis]|jgi:C4-dicarboxylate transporter DctM subunit|uniref:C4-dicarboxylate transporter DctM subunit n=1 Tax=Cytobacillus oceanisediminis TaxID=665099 RepID=A0A2V3A4T1_9BACI|nr:TRAP transporter large permease [Cytobacillus oceanisediminis]PWW31425.1 C4-dicarboxylate transporter DctM subunit [Cytobacillus oceanisediminis]